MIEDTDTEEETATQLLLDPKHAIFEKPDESKHRHLKALYVSGFVNRRLLFIFFLSILLSFLLLSN
jgi:hypothetical protein